MRRFATLIASAAILTSAPGLEQAASAWQPGLAIGTCVMTGSGLKGVITGVGDKLLKHYSIRGDLTGAPLLEYEGSVTVVPCPAGAAGANAQPALSTPPASGRTRQGGTQAITPRGGRGGCFASETGGSGLEATFRGIIRQQFEKQASAGSDGTTTVRFLSFRMDGGRRATLGDRESYNPDVRRPVYSIRAVFQTCTDYHTATATKTRERNFQCFTSSTGGPNCSASGSMAGMRPDQGEYVPK